MHIGDCYMLTGVKNKSKIGLILRKMRLDNHLSQLEMAQLLNVDQTTVSGWERGYREPTFDVIERIASICNYQVLFHNDGLKETIDTSNIDRKI